MEMHPSCPPNFELDFGRLVPLGPELTESFVRYYYYICVLMLLYMCPHTTICVSSYYYICVLILLYIGLTESLLRAPPSASSLSDSHGPTAAIHTLIARAPSSLEPQIGTRDRDEEEEEEDEPEARV
jgi:hypothetical protein